MPTTLTILMPVFNELATVETAIDDALTAELPVDARQLVIVDDGSTDGTRELLASKEWPPGGDDRRARPEPGQGRRAPDGPPARDRRLGGDPRRRPRVPRRRPRAAARAAARTATRSVVFGTRSWSSHAAFSFWYVVGNKGVTMATNVIYNCWISDVMTCHKAMSTELFRSLELRERGFAIEPEIAARVLRAGERIYEVPITYKARSREEGKKLTTLDGLRVLRTLVRCRDRLSAARVS